MPGNFWDKIRVLFNRVTRGQKPMTVQNVPYVPKPTVDKQPAYPPVLTDQDKENILTEGGRRRMLVYFEYDGILRYVEPYELAYSKDGNRIFWGFCSLHDKIHSFKLSKINNPKLTTIGYVPRWEIKL